MTVSRAELAEKRLRIIVLERDRLHHANVQLKVEINRLERTISDLNSTMDEMQYGMGDGEDI